MLNNKATCSKHVYVSFTYSVYVCDVCVCGLCLLPPLEACLQVFCHNNQRGLAEFYSMWCMDRCFEFLCFAFKYSFAGKGLTDMCCISFCVLVAAFVCYRDLAYLARKTLHALFRLGPEM